LGYTDNEWKLPGAPCFGEKAMRDIYKKAQELANLIAGSKEYGDLRQAEKLVDDNPQVKKLVDDFNRSANKIAEKEKKQEPIEVEEKHELQRLREQLQGNETLQQLLKAQTEYAMMMNKVNSILSRRLERKDESKAGE